MRGSGILVRCVLLIDFCSLLVRWAIVRKIANLEAQEGASGGLIQQHASLTYAHVIILMVLSSSSSNIGMYPSRCIGSLPVQLIVALPMMRISSCL